MVKKRCNKIYYHVQWKHRKTKHICGDQFITSYWNTDRSIHSVQQKTCRLYFLLLLTVAYRNLTAACDKSSRRSKAFCQTLHLKQIYCDLTTLTKNLQRASCSVRTSPSFPTLVIGVHHHQHRSWWNERARKLKLFTASAGCGEFKKCKTTRIAAWRQTTTFWHLRVR